MGIGTLIAVGLISLGNYLNSKDKSNNFSKEIEISEETKKKISSIKEDVSKVAINSKIKKGGDGYEIIQNSAKF